MLTVEAAVATARPSRYLVQLCRHFSQHGRHLRHRPHGHHGGDAPPSGVQVHVEWSDTQGTVRIVPWGQCTLEASSDSLLLRVEAAERESLRRIQNLVAGHLARFGRRDELTVTWLPETEGPGETGHGAKAHPAQGATVQQGHRRMVVLTTVGLLVVLVVAVHLGLGAAVQAAFHWMGWTALGLAVIPVVAVVGHLAAPPTAMGLRRLVRRDHTTHHSARLRAAPGTRRRYGQLGRMLARMHGRRD
jgi:hypothetical protein